MAGVESVNRFAMIEMDEEGNLSSHHHAKNNTGHSAKTAADNKNAKAAPAKTAANAPKQAQPQQQNNAAAAPANAGQQNGVQQDRNRTTDRNRGPRGRGRGGNSFAGGNRRDANDNSNSFRPHRGGYIGDGQQREFDRRGAPGDERPRGRPRKGGVGLGKYGDDERPRRNRPAQDGDNAETAEQDANATAETGAATDPNAVTDSTSTTGTDTTTTSTTGTDTTTTAEPAKQVEEEKDTSLTYDQYQAQLKEKAVQADSQRNLRTVEINDKQWKKVKGELDGKKKKVALTPSGQEVVVQEEERPKVEEKVEKKKKVLSLDEFVKDSATGASDSQAAGNDASSGSGDRSRGRGRGGRGGAGRGRGGFRGNKQAQVQIDDKNAFPDLSAAANKAN